MKYVYLARYYYKDGHPVFLRQVRPDESGFGFSKYNDPVVLRMLRAFAKG